MGIILQKIYDSASFDSLVKSWRNTNRHVSQYCIKYKSSTFYLENSISDDLNYKKLKPLIDITQKHLRCSLRSFLGRVFVKQNYPSLGR